MLQQWADLRANPFRWKLTEQDLKPLLGCEQELSLTNGTMIYLPLPACIQLLH